MGDTRARWPRARLRTLAILALPAALVAGSVGLLFMTSAPRPSPNAPYFAEEFSGSRLDTSKWAVETPWHTRFVTGELEWYQSSNITFPGGGIARIVTRQQPTRVDGTGVFDYTSGMLSTGSRDDRGGSSRFSFTYGYLEMRAKLPRGRGIWPAFWLTDDRTSEIDVVEVLGQTPSRAYMSLHDMAGGGPSEAGDSYDGPDFSAGFHTFAVDWQPAYIRFYIDGVQRAEFTDQVPDQPLWIVVNTAVGGPDSWPGEPDSTTVFPQYYDIDYIRVWRTRGEALGSGRRP